MQTCCKVCLASVVDLHLWVHIQLNICTLQFLYSCLGSVWMSKEQSLHTSLLLGHFFLFSTPSSSHHSSTGTCEWLHLNCMSGFVLNLDSIVSLRQSSSMSSSEAKCCFCSPVKLVIFTVYLIVILPSSPRFTERPILYLDTGTLLCSVAVIYLSPGGFLAS